MGNTLLNYLSSRINRPTVPIRDDKPAGPVITISREVGCSGLELAYALKNKLNSVFLTDCWKVLSKEIFQESARELNLDPDKVAKIFKQVDRTSFDEILQAFGDKRFKSEKKIKKTVIEVIRGFAEDGFCIIVGRAGNVVAADIKNALHIRMVAPLEFRIRSIKERNNLDRENAVHFIANVEKERYAYRHAVMDKHNGPNELFDITFNRAEFSTEDMVEIIMMVIERKGILMDYKTKMDFS